jgi:hypothetical protein
MIKLENLKKYLSTNNISFLINLDKTINIDKSGKSYYYKIYRIELNEIKNFVLNLKENEVYIVNPIISINCKHNDPYLTLSRQFLITNKSNPNLIYNYLMDQLEIASNDFQFHDDYYFLIFKYKKVQLDHRVMG